MCQAFATQHTEWLGIYIRQTSKLGYPKNLIVDEVPEFNEIGKTVYQSLEKTAIYVLRAISLFLDLEEDHFDKYVKKGNSILRPIHYPPILEKPKDVNDYFLLTSD